MNVDLPAPLGPRRPVMPGGTLTLTSLRPITWPYHFDTCSAATTGAPFGVTALAPAAAAAATPAGISAEEAGTLMSPPLRRARGAAESSSTRRRQRRGPRAR